MYTGSKIVSQRVYYSAAAIRSIACYAEHCLSYDRFCLTVCLTVRHTLVSYAKTTPAKIMRSSLEDGPMTLVSQRLTSARNSKGNIGNEGAE